MGLFELYLEPELPTPPTHKKNKYEDQTRFL